jgi:hypothetical protein
MTGNGCAYMFQWLESDAKQRDERERMLTTAAKDLEAWSKTQKGGLRHQVYQT